MSPIYEVVSGDVLLSHRRQFLELHSGVLLPIMKEIGIKPVLMLITEIGQYGRFLDVYRYASLSEYERLTDELIEHPQLPSYYQQVGQCISGTISIQIMRDLPYAEQWTQS